MGTTTFFGEGLDANPPQGPVTFGVPATQQVSLEDFEPYTVGPLGSQGLWGPQRGGTNPSIQVIADSLIDGVQAASFLTTGGGPTTPGGVSIILPKPILSNQTGRIRYRVRVGAGAVQILDQSPFIGFLDGAMDVVAFANDAFSVAFHYNVGLLAVEFSVYDQTNESGDHFNTGIAADTPFSLTHVLRKNGVYDILLNDAPIPIVSDRQMTTGNEDILRWYLGHAGIVPGGPVVIDTVSFDRSIP